MIRTIYNYRWAKIPVSIILFNIINQIYYHAGWLWASILMSIPWVIRYLFLVIENKILFKIKLISYSVIDNEIQLCFADNKIYRMKNGNHIHEKYDYCISASSGHWFEYPSGQRVSNENFRSYLDEEYKAAKRREEWDHKQLL